MKLYKSLKNWLTELSSSFFNKTFIRAITFNSNSNENSVEVLTIGSLEFISLPIEMEEITLAGSGSSDRPRLS